MATTTPYPDFDDDVGVRPRHWATTGTSRWQQMVGILGLVVVLWVGSEMYDVVFFDGFGPGAGGDMPAENQGPDDGGVHTPGPPAGGH